MKHIPTFEEFVNEGIFSRDPEIFYVHKHAGDSYPNDAELEVDKKELTASNLEKIVRKLKDAGFDTGDDKEKITYKSIKEIGKGIVMLVFQKENIKYFFEFWKK